MHSTAQAPRMKMPDSLLDICRQHGTRNAPHAPQREALPLEVA